MTAHDAPTPKRAGAVIMAVAVALLPKCPACWSVYAGLSSALGIRFVLDPTLLLALTLGSLALALAALASIARRTRRYLPLAFAGAGALGVWAGKFVLNSDALVWVGLLGLVAASLAARRSGGRPLTRASELAEHAQAR